MSGLPPVIQRTLTHYQRYGAQRTLDRIALELRLRYPPPWSRATARKLDIKEHRPRHIKASLDAPREGATEGSATLLVIGWAFSERGDVQVTTYLDGASLEHTTSALARPDVAALYQKSRTASRCGFSARLSLEAMEPGRHTLHVVLRDQAGAVRVMTRTFRRAERETLYHQYYERMLPTDHEVGRIRAATLSHGAPPIKLVVWGGTERERRATLRSIADQGYPDVLPVVLRGPGAPSPMARADGTAARDLAQAMPERVDSGRLVGFMHAGEVLTPAALWRFARCAQQTSACVIYSDHDAVDETARHVEPWFVPDWAPNHLLAQDYVGGVYLVRDSNRLRDALQRVDLEDDAWRYRLLLQVTHGRQPVTHEPSVLWSRPAAESPPQLAAAEFAAVDSALVERGSEASVIMRDAVTSDRPLRHVSWPLWREPLVSVIIPTTGQLDLVRQSVASLDRTAYPHMEVIFIDNGRGRHPDGIDYLRRRDVTVLVRDEPFNWARLNNAGTRVARGELLLFLNDDVEATDPGWLTHMVRLALRPRVGAVGSLMTYPDGSIQHVGVFLVGHGGGAIHLFRGLDPAEGAYLDWHLVAREVTAVTGACMLVRRDVFDEVDGFDEDLAIVGNDVDVCLRIARTGRHVVIEPEARLVHHESRSREGVDHYPDEGRMWDRWADVLRSGDPHYNPNLSQDRTDASLEWGRVDGRADLMTRLDPDAGVNLVGYIRAEMGLGEAVRSEARALQEAEIPFVILDHQAGTPARLGDGSWAHRVAEAPHFDTNILHINADLLPQALQQLPDRLTRHRRNIGVWTWELPEFPAEWRGSFRLVDEVWVPSTFVQAAIGKDAPVPVNVIPHAVRAPRGPFLEREYYGLPARAVQFLMMYDTQSVMERKNPQGAIAAYMRAFDPDDAAVSLVVKVNTAGDREVGALREMCAGYPNIHLVTDVLDRRAVDSLIATSDVFISLHRAEGFGLPMAEAMAAGKPVIATGWSGNMDFMSDEVAACVRFRLVELERSFGPYRAGQHWAEPDLDDAATWMRSLRDDWELRTRLGDAAAHAIAQTLDPEVVGALIRDQLGLAASPSSQPAR